MEGFKEEEEQLKKDKQGYISKSKKMREDVDEVVSPVLISSRDSMREEEILEEIRQIAYDLYEKKGKLPGTEFASWLEAVQIVKSRS